MRTSKILILLLLLTRTAFAQIDQTLSITGEVARPLTLTRQDLSALRSVAIEVKDRDNKLHQFKGVALFEVLQRAGVTTGSLLRGENLAKYLLIGAADGYEVVYSLPEIDPEFTDQVVLLAIEKDGQPLPAGEGTFRLIVPQDKKQARWIREVRTIKVRFAKD
jgi:DMSO/TMAO reductase YedYZ molybdopterin-dependent catalytic subunit